MAVSCFSHGKLLLSAEYLVLDGALALAVPTRQGQGLVVSESEGVGRIFWRAFHPSGLWLEAELDRNESRVLQTNLPQPAEFVLKTLQVLKELQPQCFESNKNYHFTTRLDFPPDYGFGSSSTLMTNLAKWAGVDPYELNRRALGGSGYDIAVAWYGESLLYRHLPEGPRVKPIPFKPSFAEELLLVHLGQKQDSREGIRRYREKKKNLSLIQEVSDLTRQIVQTQDLETFSRLMTRHETLIATHLDLVPVKKRLFPDCPSFVKSLGAWGGDFVLTQKFPGYQDFFKEKGFTTLLNYSETIL